MIQNSSPSFLITLQSDGYRELAMKLNRKKDSIRAWFAQRRKSRRRDAQESFTVFPVKAEITVEVYIFCHLEGRESNQMIKEIEESEESDEDEYEILTTTTTIQKSIYVGGPIINKEGVKVGSVTAEEVREYF